MGTLDFIQKELKIISSFFLKLFDENKFVKSANLLPFSMKLIDQIQKLSHFPILGLFSINSCNNIFISDYFLTPKLSKYIILLHSHKNLFNKFLLIYTHTAYVILI